MTNAQRNQAISRGLEAYTKKHTASKAAARTALIAEGIYTQSGKLRAEFGGKHSKIAAKKAS